MTAIQPGAQYRASLASNPDSYPTRWATHITVDLGSLSTVYVLCTLHGICKLQFPSPNRRRLASPSMEAYFLFSRRFTDPHSMSFFL